MRTPVIVIIGAGFSGTMTAVQLMRQSTVPLRIVLVNKSGRMARGLAYGTRSPAHLLNVPAGNMSALPDAPDDFVEYCRWANPDVAPHSFVPRVLYGAYLEALLSRTESEASGGAHVLERLTGEVIDVERGGTASAAATTLTLADGTRLDCDVVVLAFGHFPPRDVLPRAVIDALGSRYVADPWAGEPLATIARDADVLLVGNGLTALDVVTSLDRLGHTGKIVCVSRRGLLPRAHRTGGAPATSKTDGAALAAAMGNRLRGQLRTLRTAVARALANGEDWRDVIGALRPHTPALWRSLGIEDRRRFLRHVQPYWEVLRHRCAPEALQRLETLKQGGRYACLAGRLLGAQIGDGRPELSVALRGTGESWSRQFDAVVNCTGPTSDPTRIPVPLLRRLREQRRLLPDPLGLGLAVDDHYAVLSAHAQPQPWLRYIGPQLKARDWEATAVPELRSHAQRLASELLAAIEGAQAATGEPAGIAPV